MTWIEYFNKRLTEEIAKGIDDIKQEVIEYLNNNVEVSIRLKNYGLLDVIDFKENPDSYFEQHPVLTLDQNGLEFSGMSLSQVKLAISNLNPDLEYLESPLSFFKQLKLNNYPKLKRVLLNLSDDNISVDQINSIFNNSSIDEINCNKKFDDTILEKSTFVSCGGKLNGLLNGKKIGFNLKNTFLRDTAAIVYNDDLNKNVDEVFSLLKKTDKEKVTQIKFYDQYTEYDKMTTDFDSFKYCIEYGQNDDLGKEKCTLTANSIESLKQLNSFINKAKENGYSIDKLALSLENKNYDDIEMLYDLSKKYDLVVKVGNYRMNAVDFISMRETLNYYKDLILQENFSPLERAAYGYDIIKSFVYKETESKNKLESREISEIIKTGNIVCVGYANFYAQLMKEVGIDGFSFGTTVPVNGENFGHQRCILNIDDNKYNVHGSFAFDPTWDCAIGLARVADKDGNERLISTYRTELKEDEKIVKTYDDISRYRYFLIGKDSYTKTFEGERMPNYEYSTYYGSCDDKAENIKDKFDLSNASLPLKQFENLIYNVKLAEGYPMDTMDQTLNDVLEANGLKERNIKGKGDYNHKL